MGAKEIQRSGLHVYPCKVYNRYRPDFLLHKRRRHLFFPDIRKETFFDTNVLMDAAVPALT
jgi:hypothetical protein